MVNSTELITFNLISLFQVDLYANALFMQETLGQTSQKGLYISVLILLAIAAVFTIAGGLTAVIWTDLLQLVLMILGALILAVEGNILLNSEGFNNLVYLRTASLLL